MLTVELVTALQRINERLATQARRGNSDVTFVCECGQCRGEFVAISLAQYDEIRGRGGLVRLPNH